jgi:hypothetical protein
MASCNVVVDPRCIAFMGEVESAQSVRTALIVAADLARIGRTWPNSLLITSADFHESIYGSGLFPFRNALAPLIQKAGLSEEFDSHTVSTMLDRIIDRVVCVEEVSVFDALVVNAINSDPAIVDSGKAPLLQAGLNDLLSFFAAGLLEDEHWTFQAILALSPSTPLSSEIEVQSDVGLIEPPLTDGPQQFTSTFQIPRLNSYAEFFQKVDTLELWNAATCGQEIKLAVVSRAHQLRLQQGLPFSEEVELLAVGDNFFPSLPNAQAHCQAPFASTTLETCARICGGLPQSDDNAFQTAAGSGVQVIRAGDSAAARRVHVTKHGIGVRLMYWRLADGTVELANVGPKAEEAIY